METEYIYSPQDDPTDMDAEVEKIYNKLIEAGYEFYHLYDKYYFFWDGKWPFPFAPTATFRAVFNYRGIILDWSRSCQRYIAKRVMEKCKAISLPWTPLPQNPRDITDFGNLPRRDDYDAYTVCLFIDGAYKTPDGGVRTHLKRINGVLRSVARVRPGYPIYEPKPKHNKLQISDNNRNSENNNPGDQA
ncbi:hypothetical protein KKH27_02920 [bacterium]|nr:hypothetical protein [bacterium]